MAERPDFQARQYAFAAHIRDPENAPLPGGIDDRRMAVYRGLFLNNLRNLLGTMFPVLRKLHDEAGWRRLVRGFMRVHRSRTPYFLQLPREFLAYLETEHEPGQDDLPFLAELAHYEYAELEVSIESASDDPGAVDAAGDLLAGVPVRTAAARVYAYHWPVHRIGPEFIPEQPAEQPVFLAVYRDPQDRVRFLELNPVTAELLVRIGDNASNRTGAGLLEALARDSCYADATAFVAHGGEMLREMRAAGLLTGVLKT